MAAIGEQLTEFVHEKDEICGVSISTRDKEDVVLIWNTSAEFAKESRILDCLRLILPDTNFLSTFYKRMLTMSEKLIILVSFKIRILIFMPIFSSCHSSRFRESEQERSQPWTGL